MPKKREGARIQKGSLSAQEAEKLFATVDETGHTNEETAKKQHKRRREVGQGVDVDPLSDADPSGSNVEKVITKTAVAFVAIFLAVVVVLQVSYGIARRASTANLAEAVNVTNVASALRGGVEWGNGFTQFPEEFQVQEADENTHRIEVTVTDTSSEDALEAFAGSQIQANALAVNALLNPNINTVIYHVNVHMDEKGNFQNAKFFGFIKPTGEVKTIMTFIWTKTTTSDGEVRFNCTITGVDADMQAKLKESITSAFTPITFISNVLEGTSSTDSNSKNTSGESTGLDTTSGKSSGESTSESSSESADGSVSGSSSQGEASTEAPSASTAQTSSSGTAS